MKFLCVPCDSPMRLRATEETEPGSLAVVYTCPRCGYEMAMLTNAQETQMVRSLGVRIGPPNTTGGAAAAAAAIDAPGAPSGNAAAGGKCPFPAMLGLSAEPEAASPPAAELVWTPEALARLQAIPEFVRPMARAGIEKVAQESGHRLIDESVLAAARARFGM
jgi:hypothetical protein